MHLSLLNSCWTFLVLIWYGILHIWIWVNVVWNCWMLHLQLLSIWIVMKSHYDSNHSNSTMAKFLKLNTLYIHIQQLLLHWVSELIPTTQCLPWYWTGISELSLQLWYYTVAHKRRYWVLPTMHCFQWDILYRWLCGFVSDKTCLKFKIEMTSDN